MTDSSTSGLASSMTDLMTSLAVIFILLLVATWHNERQRGAATRKEVREVLKQELNRYERLGLRVEDDPEDPLGLLVIVNEALLRFAWSKDEVPPEGTIFLKAFIPVMANILCGTRYASAIESVVIEGHTDSSGKDDANLELSQRRSMAVVRIALMQLADSTEALNPLRERFLRLISANGRGEMDLLKDASGHEDAARSRRVVFKIRVKSSDQQLLERQLAAPPDAHTALQP